MNRVYSTASNNKYPSLPDTLFASAFHLTTPPTATTAAFAQSGGDVLTLEAIFASLPFTQQ